MSSFVDEFQASNPFLSLYLSEFKIWKRFPIFCKRSTHCCVIWTKVCRGEIRLVIEGIYSHARSFQIQRQNEQRCEQEIEDIKRGVKAGNITPNTSLIRFSDEALDEQKHSIRIADEKMALAVQAYDLVDAHIQQLDQFLKLCDEDNRRERDTAAAAPALLASSLDGGTKSGRGSESGRGGRKKNLALKMKLLTKMQFLSVMMMGNILGASTPCQPSDRLSCRIQVSVKELKRAPSLVEETTFTIIKSNFICRTRLVATEEATETEVAVATTFANTTGMQLDLPVDPNEPTYCFCNQVSYGDMIACDNPDCKIEWFHFGCVGLKEKVKGKWYCSDCAPLKNRRRGR
ncbi:hypothetical protein POTOM_012581 [Populus tomentosa]|uniref:PHD finger protein ING n=1 Tax=Populus tomentosa TaxID=118781 RepID=A0A8X8A5H7_POPTO|nr:hypothetical protein POTOM_012581 [Populus tomentosa]